MIKPSGRRNAKWKASGANQQLKRKEQCLLKSKMGHIITSIEKYVTVVSLFY